MLLYFWCRLDWGNEAETLLQFIESFAQSFLFYCSHLATFWRLHLTSILPFQKKKKIQRLKVQHSYQCLYKLQSSQTAHHAYFNLFISDSLFFKMSQFGFAQRLREMLKFKLFNILWVIYESSVIYLRILQKQS